MNPQPAADGQFMTPPPSQGSGGRVVKIVALVVIGLVVWVMKSKPAAGGRLRLSSVKNENIPPPIAIPGKAARVAR